MSLRSAEKRPKCLTKICKYGQLTKSSPSGGREETARFIAQRRDLMNSKLTSRIAGGVALASAAALVLAGCGSSGSAGGGSGSGGGTTTLKLVVADYGTGPG